MQKALVKIHNLKQALFVSVGQATCVLVDINPPFFPCMWALSAGGAGLIVARVISPLTLISRLTSRCFFRLDVESLDAECSFADVKQSYHCTLMSWPSWPDLSVKCSLNFQAKNAFLSSSWLFFSSFAIVIRLCGRYSLAWLAASAHIMPPASAQCTLRVVP